jgi:hypothetical protein
MLERHWEDDFNAELGKFPAAKWKGGQTSTGQHAALWLARDSRVLIALRQGAPMSDMQKFIAVPTEPQRFAARVRQSLKTSLAFIMDQRWASLIFLLVYLGLMYWDYLSVRLLPSPPPPEWTDNWPEILDPLKLQLAREALGTWRSLLAALVTVLYWGNALLFIADRAAAFENETVVGLGRYLLRGSCIALLLALPLAIGLVLLFIPGLLVAGVLISAATVSMFRENSTFKAIGEGYRLVTQSLPGQVRILGFSRSFAHIVGAYGLVILTTLLFAGVAIFLAAGLALVIPSLTLPLSYAQNVISDLVGSFLNLSFSIFVLRLYSEYRTLVRRYHNLSDPTAESPDEQETRQNPKFHSTLRFTIRP